MNIRPDQPEDRQPEQLETPERAAYEAPKVQSVKLSDEAAQALT